MRSYVDAELSPDHAQVASNEPTGTTLFSMCLHYFNIPKIGGEFGGLRVISK